MTTTIITRSTLSTTGYAIELYEDGVLVQSLAIEEIVDEGKTLKLPVNPSNRKYFSIKKVEEAGGQIELSYKETRTIKGNTNRKTAKDYLTAEEQAIIDELLGRAHDRLQAAREEAKKPMSKEEKLRAKIAKLEAELAALDAEENTEEESEA